MRSTLLLSAVLSLVACSGGSSSVDGAALAKEVCDCTTKVNAIKTDSPDRKAKMEACNELQAKTWATVKGTDQQDAYNAGFPCGM